MSYSESGGELAANEAEVTQGDDDFTHMIFYDPGEIEKVRELQGQDAFGDLLQKKTEAQPSGNNRICIADFAPK